MTPLVQTSVEPLANAAPCFHIALSAPRSNALEPGLLNDLHRALDALEASGARAAVITGGRNFSTGGDVGRFFDAVMLGEGAAYAKAVVPALQNLVLRMIEMPVIFACAARGATTGGAAGLLWAADTVVLSPDAFVQPYYATVGFAPDGGWTAVLPERIGVGKAYNWLLKDTRHTATELHQLGLARTIDAAPEARAASILAQMDLDVALEAKALMWDGARRALVEDRLAAETAAFLRRIQAPETRQKMAEFLGKTEVTPNV